MEYLILLLLGSSNKEKLSHLHIQKEIFMLKKATDSLKPLFRFIKHYRGPYSPEIAETLKSPMFLDNCWSFSSEESDKKYSGGVIHLTEDGKKEYDKLVEDIHAKGNDKLIQIMAGMRLIHDLYDDLDPKELLYVVYKTDEFKEYTEKSIVSEEVIKSDAKDHIKKQYLNNLDFNEW
ncbi:MAG: hypothetical protein ACOCT9_02790 [archaeon]